MVEPKVSVGIMFEPKIIFELNGVYNCNSSSYTGEQQVLERDGRVDWNGELYNELLFTPADHSQASFMLKDVTIGINFHWERKENQVLEGL